MEKNTREEVRVLLERVREISMEEKNRKKTDFWEPQPETARDHWRGTPKPRRDVRRAPITVEPEIPMWGEMLGFNPKEYFVDPAVYVKSALRMMIYRYEHWSEDTCVAREIPIWLGVTFESSMFGARTIYADDQYPWLDRDCIVGEKSDLDALEAPDFFRSGLMPLAHRFYEEIGGVLDDDFKVTFPEWGRSPFGVAFHLRGMENLSLDMIRDPGFFHRLMRFITDARKHWVEERAKFLHRNVEKGNLYNDEINCPTLSPGMYEELVLPYEVELSNFHGGILYWHSCGDNTLMLPFIKRIPGLEMLHVGPWTDVGNAARVFGGSVPLEICLHPVRDVQSATPAWIERKLTDIKRACGSHAYTVRADGIQVLYGLAADLERISRWISVADRILGS
jgi:hypothetical protein